MELSIVAGEAAVVPDVQQRRRERPVPVGLHGRLIVLARRHQEHGRRHVSLGGPRRALTNPEIPIALRGNRACLLLRRHCPHGEGSCRRSCRRCAMSCRHIRIGLASLRRILEDLTIELPDNGAAVATVGNDDHTHTRCERGQRLVDLIVEHFPIEQQPRLIQTIGFLGIRRGHLTPVPGVRDDADVTGHQLRRSAVQCRKNRGRRGPTREQDTAFEPYGTGESGHRGRIVLRAVERTVPTRVRQRVDVVETDMERESGTHGSPIG